MKQMNLHSRKPRLAIVDPCSAAGYGLINIENGKVGGTEATVLRVCRFLSAEFEVTHFQRGRVDQLHSAAGLMRPLERAFDDMAADGIIVINAWKVALKLRKAHPDQPIFLWLHIYPGRHNRSMGTALHDAGVSVICVSESHARKLDEFLAGSATPNIGSIYNPIADDLHPDETPRDPNRLLFASSPHKGLAEVFEQFAALRSHFPKLKLAVADPGYLRWDVGVVPGNVVFLGSLSHSKLIREMRRSLCLFYPQTTFAETFGLVLAEANAVGTPVLVHQGLGANDEIVSDNSQRVDGRELSMLIERLAEWQQVHPRITANSTFRLQQVGNEWARYLHRALSTTHMDVSLYASGKVA